MFDNLTDRLSRTLRNISGRGRLTEDNIKKRCAKCAWRCWKQTSRCRLFVILSTAVIGGWS